MNKNFNEMLESGARAFLILFAFMAIISLFCVALMIRSERNTAQRKLTRGELVIKVLIYYFLSGMFIGALLFIQSSIIRLYEPGSFLSLSQADFGALVTAASLTGYILLLVGCIKAVRAQGRNEKVPLKPKVLITVGSLLFACSMAASIVLIVK